MTNRYFYSEPLAAAWMAKHFGMRLLADAGDADDRRVDIMQRCVDVNVFGDILSIDYIGKLYIHPNSLPLLEPRIGDLIYITESIIGTLARRHDGNLKLFTGDWLIKPDHVSIIRRDGKPFFWPESEEAD